MIHFTNNKAEVSKLIAQMIIDFEIGSGKQIRTIQSDNGSEFVNSRVRALLLYERIAHCTSSPYTPQQNGLVERTVQVINNAQDPDGVEFTVFNQTSSDCEAYYQSLWVPLVQTINNRKMSHKRRLP